MSTRQRDALLVHGEVTAVCRDREPAVIEAAAARRPCRLGVRNDVGATIAHGGGLRGDWLGDRGAVIQGGWLADG